MIRPKQDRRPFKNDGRPSGMKWIDHAEGWAVRFRPKIGGPSHKLVPIIFKARVEDKAGGVECLICGVTLSQLPSHINRVHGVSGSEYKKRFGNDAPLVDADHLAAYTKICRERGARRHANNIRACLECSAPFRRGQKTCRTYSADVDRPARRLYCSDACTAKARTRTAKGRTEHLTRITHNEARQAYIDRCKAERIARCTTNCIVCGQSFIAPSLVHGEKMRARLVGLCSTTCRTEHRRRVRAQS